MRRRSIVAVSAGVLVVFAAVPAQALELGEYLRRSGEAEFTGRQVVACATPDGVRDAVLEVEQADGVLVVREPVSEGSAVTMSAVGTAVASDDGSVSTTVVTGRDEDGIHDYQVVAEQAVVYQGRSATEVTVRRDGIDRARMTFDSETGALVRTETLNLDGSRYCEISMTGFSPGTGDLLSALVPVDPNASALPEVDGADLPAELGGFDRIDVYELREGQVVAYYSDGLFSFTLLRSDRPLDPGDLAVFDGDRGPYHRSFGPNQALYVWTADDVGYALLGDQPLDLQDQVLADLPAPSTSGFWNRFWRRLFG